MAKSSTFVQTIDLSLAKKLSEDLKSQGFELTQPQYTVFSAKKPDVSCTLYQSGKLTVQGKGMNEFIEFYLEPIILKTFTHTYEDIESNVTARIGIDESGKGDYFGPLCIAGVFTEGNSFARLKSLGIKDSKAMTDKSILIAAKALRSDFAHHIVKINPLKYNELYDQFKNLNRLLAWGHATTIEHLAEKTNCNTVIVDQFADEHVVLTALKRKKLMIELTQRHRAEEDIVVAAASILARETFLRGLEELSEKYGIRLPKGASSATINAGKEFVRKFGFEMLGNVAKLHFKTTLVIS
jgi:ribonuclease HIII